MANKQYPNFDVSPGTSGQIIRLGPQGAEVLERHWGLKPTGERKSPIINVRAENRIFREGRCLALASEFFVFAGSRSPKTRWRVTVRGTEWFCFAAIWRPAAGNWPESYAVITVPAGQDLIKLTKRQMAIVAQKDWMAWLQGAARPESVLRPSAKGTLKVELAMAANRSAH